MATVLTYPQTLLRLLFPHVYLNEGRGILDWKWIRVNAGEERSAWFYEYRFEAGLIWALELMGLIWLIIHTHGLFPMLSAFAEVFGMLWVLYGLVLNRALRWSAPNLATPLTVAEKRERKKRRGRSVAPSLVGKKEDDTESGEGDK